MLTHTWNTTFSIKMVIKLNNSKTRFSIEKAGFFMGKINQKIWLILLQPNLLTKKLHPSPKN